MRIKLRYFASLRERLGKSEEIREVPAEATVQTVWEMLKREHPNLATIERSNTLTRPTPSKIMTNSLSSRRSVGAVMSNIEARILCKLTQSPIDTQELSDFVADPGAGALTTFVGTTRNTNDGRRVIRLEYECYPGMAEKEMMKIAAEALARWPVVKIAMIHRLGRVDIGEASVAIAVSSGHRHAAFEACHYAINQLKETVPIWKKELYEGGELWIGSQTGASGSFQRVQEDRA
jgi:molybdopterin synthase catalytic subunit